MSTLKTAKWYPFCAFFTSTYHTKHLNPWPSSSASYVVNYNWLSACQGEMEPFDKPQKQATAKAAWATFSTNIWLNLLVNVYSYHLMVKSVSCCYVRGRRLFSNPVTDTVVFSPWNLDVETTFALEVTPLKQDIPFSQSVFVNSAKDSGNLSIFLTKSGGDVHMWTSMRYNRYHW